MAAMVREHVQVKEYPLLSPKLRQTLDTYIIATNRGNNHAVIPTEVDDIDSFEARFTEDCNNTIQNEWLKVVAQFEAICYKAIFEICDNLRNAIK